MTLAERLRAWEEFNEWERHQVCELSFIERLRWVDRARRFARGLNPQPPRDPNATAANVHAFHDGLRLWRTSAS